MELGNWPPQCNGLKIAVLADLHVGSPYKGMAALEEVVRLTNEVQADLVLLPGDFVIQGVVGGSFVAPERAAGTLAEIRAPLGTFAVLGNHDWVLGVQRVIAALSSAGIRVLEDTNTPLAWGQCRFTLAGISDYWYGPHNVDAALAVRPAHQPVLAFTHNPDVFPQVPDFVSLLIAGHTHGGQVDLPILGRLIVPSAFGDRYAIGHIVEDNKNLFVSPGIGTSIIPVRFRVPPEVSVLSLYGQDAR